jgi:hypothetical protein
MQHRRLLQNFWTAANQIVFVDMKRFSKDEWARGASYGYSACGERLPKHLKGNIDFCFSFSIYFSFFLGILPSVMPRQLQIIAAVGTKYPAPLLSGELGDVGFIGYSFVFSLHFSLIFDMLLS